MISIVDIGKEQGLFSKGKLTIPIWSLISRFKNATLLWNGFILMVASSVQCQTLGTDAGSPGLCDD